MKSIVALVCLSLFVVSTPAIASQILSDTSFEGGYPNSAWSTWNSCEGFGGSCGDNITTEVPYTGSWGATMWVELNIKRSIWQDVTVPSDATSTTLCFWLNTSTLESSGQSDYLKAEIRDTSSSGFVAPSSVLETVVALYDDYSRAYPSSWNQKCYTLGSSYAGQTIRVFLKTFSDIDDYMTDWDIDDVTLTTSP